jgi:hypothetical protein
VPILCVDVPLSRGGNPRQVALIRRAAYEDGGGEAVARVLSKLGRT